MLLRLLFLLLFTAGSFAHQERKVVIANGTVIGSRVTVQSAAAWQFLGIPYAEKPLGPLRFAKSRPLQNGWSEPLIANRPPNRCPQILSFVSIDHKVAKEWVAPFDEDCLYLNIWTPYNTKEPKTVMVWIHSNGYTVGEGLPWHNGAPLAALNDVVLVTLHFRLGALGFLRLSESVGGNWGLWDQQLALRWVQENIAAFGGDPQRVTLFGESAGASSATLHLFNPQSARLFRRVIAQSGSSHSAWAVTPHAALTAQQHMQFARRVGCAKSAEVGVLACLRRKDVTELIAGQEDVRWLPVVDGDFLAAWPQELSKRHVLTKEFMIGAAEDEGGMNTEMMLSLLRKKEGQERPSEASKTPLERVLTDAIFAHYPFYPQPMTPLAKAAVAPQLTSHVDPQDPVLNLKRINKAFGDWSFVCPVNHLADDLDRHGVPTFVYLFAHRSSFSRYPPHVGPTHMEELHFVFRHDLTYPHIAPMTEDERSLAGRIAEEWTSFAKTGRPASPEWRRFSGAKREFFEFGVRPAVKEGGLHRDDCSFWNEVLPKLHAAAEMPQSRTDMSLVIAVGVLIGVLIFLLTKN